MFESHANEPQYLPIKTAARLAGVSIEVFLLLAKMPGFPGHLARREFDVAAILAWMKTIEVPKATRHQRYREANREKVRQAGRDYRAANREKVKERLRRYRRANPDKVREANRRRYAERKAKNRDAINAGQRRRYAERKAAFNPTTAADAAQHGG